MQKSGIKHSGFTLIEIIVVIAVLAILIAIAVPVYYNLLDEAIDKTLLASICSLSTYIKAETMIGNFDEEHIFTYKKNAKGDTEYLSRYLECQWEILNGSGDSDNANILGIENQVSRKIGVVNWPSNLGDGLYAQQALYITTDHGARYTPGSRRTVNDYYRGAIVLWYNASTASQIYLYYVSQDGMQSEKYYVYEKNGIE